MTRTQHETLKWLADIGGVCLAWRDKVVDPSSKPPGRGTWSGSEKRMPAISALHLVQRGCIEARDGQLHITERGRRELKP